MAEANDYPSNAAHVTQGLDPETDHITVPIRSNFPAWQEANPALAQAADHIGSVLGIGPISAAQAIALYRDWIG